MSAFELSVLELMVREKLESPLAATVAALILLRANRLDLLHDWVRNLANWFTAQPDGAVLWAAQLLRQRPRGLASAIADAAEYVLQLRQRGLPHTSEGLAYAATLCSTLDRLGTRVPADTHAQLAQLSERIQTALTYFRPGGLFTTYAGFTPQTAPTTFLGPFVDSGVL